MRKFIVVLISLACFANSFGQSLQKDVVSKRRLNVEINRNAELLGFSYLLGFEGPDLAKEKGVTIANSYGLKLFEKYKKYSVSENALQAKSLTQHLWLDYILKLLLQVDDFPHAKLDSVDKAYFIKFSKRENLAEATENATLFLEAMNNLYVEVNFDQYLEEAEVYYEAARKEVEGNMPDDEFINAMENFYRKKFNRYTLVPSLIIPKGMGFGLSYTKGGATNLFNIFGTFNTQSLQRTDSLDMGFVNKNRLRELSVHEFGHPFVNPEVDQLPAEMIDATRKLYAPIKADMTRQNYTTWKACLYEHFVRAGEVVIARSIGRNDDAERLQTNYISNRKFIYLPVIIEELTAYQNQKTYTYGEAMKKVMVRLEGIEK